MTRFTINNDHYIQMQSFAVKKGPGLYGIVLWHNDT